MSNLSKTNLWQSFECLKDEEVRCAGDIGRGDKRVRAAWGGAIHTGSGLAEGHPQVHRDIDRGDHRVPVVHRVQPDGDHGEHVPEGVVRQALQD